MTGTQPVGTGPRPPTRLHTVVLGAGGRAGRAVSRELVTRGHRVTGVVRDLRRHSARADFAALAGLGVDVAEADVTRGADLVEILPAADVVIVAVTPFSAPPPSFDGFDEAFYENVVAGVVGAVRRSPATRLITIGLFATLTLADGRTVMDDPAVFPPGLLPFARAHARELPALRRLASGHDWLVVTPPAGLRADGADETAGYALVEPPVDHRLFDGVLGYGQLARAVADQSETPTLHRTQVAVLPTPP